MMCRKAHSPKGVGFFDTKKPSMFPWRASSGWLRGLEPPTTGITIQGSNQLSYSHRRAGKNSTNVGLFKD